jgi:hypothetical protein
MNAVYFKAIVLFYFSIKHVLDFIICIMYYLKLVFLNSLVQFFKNNIKFLYKEIVCSIFTL